MNIPTFTPNDQTASRPEPTRIDVRYAAQQETPRFAPRNVSEQELLWYEARNAPLLNEPTMASEPDGFERRLGVGVDQQKLWAGGAASAVVVGLVALVGVLVMR